MNFNELKPLEKVSNELLRRLWEAFPEMKFEPNGSWCRGIGTIMCTLYADNALVVGFGQNMDDCYKSLIDSVNELKEMYNLERIEL